MHLGGGVGKGVRAETAVGNPNPLRLAAGLPLGAWREQAGPTAAGGSRENDLQTGQTRRLRESRNGAAANQCRRDQAVCVCKSTSAHLQVCPFAGLPGSPDLMGLPRHLGG